MKDTVTTKIRPQFDGTDHIKARPQQKDTACRQGYCLLPQLLRKAHGTFSRALTDTKDSGQKTCFCVLVLTDITTAHNRNRKKCKHVQENRDAYFCWANSRNFGDVLGAYALKVVTFIL